MGEASPLEADRRAEDLSLLRRGCLKEGVQSRMGRSAQIVVSDFQAGADVSRNSGPGNSADRGELVVPIWVGKKSLGRMGREEYLPSRAGGRKLSVSYILFSLEKHQPRRGREEGGKGESGLRWWIRKRGSCQSHCHAHPGPQP